MEVVVQSPSSPTMDNFDFSSGAMTSPYLSAPSSPKRFGEYYLSAPASPSRIAELYSEFEYFASIADSSTIEAAATNRNDVDVDDGEEDNFAFFVSRESEKPSLSAEELFDGGKIKPLKTESIFFPQSKGGPVSETEQRRGRDRAAATLSSSNSGRRVARSHSPFRKPHHTWESDHQQQQQEKQQPRRNKEESSSNSCSSLSNSGASILSSSNSSGSSSKGSSSRRWKLKDLLLFRSASEGRGSSKDALNKYPVAFKKSEEVRSSSFRSSADGSRRKGPVSAHEFHYAMKKAESEDMRKRTFLPYKQGILGRLSGFGL